MKLLVADDNGTVIDGIDVEIDMLVYAMRGFPLPRAVLMEELASGPVREYLAKRGWQVPLNG